MAVRRYTFRLKPSKQAADQLFRARRLHCYLYNACVDHRRYEYKANQKSISYLDQQNILPAFKKEWVEFAELNCMTLQATVKRVDLAFNAFFKGLRGFPKYKSIRNYSGWAYPSLTGWKVTTQDGLNGRLTLRDLGIEIPMRGKTKVCGHPTTCTIVYKPNTRQWFASFTVEIPDAVEVATIETGLPLAIDLGTETALTTFDGTDYQHIENPRYIGRVKTKIRTAEKQKRRKRAPNYKKGVKASKRWKKAQKRVSQLKSKAANQRKHWVHEITTEIASRHDIVVTEKLNVRGMTRKAKKGSARKAQKAGLNKSILDVGFGMLRSNILYKVAAKGGLVFELPTREVKPSQRCPECGKVHKDWAQLSERYHVCECGYQGQRDETSTLVMWKWLYGTLPGLETSLAKRGCSSSTEKTRKHTGSLKQLGQMKRQKSDPLGDDGVKTPSAYAVG